MEPTTFLEKEHPSIASLRIGTETAVRHRIESGQRAIIRSPVTMPRPIRGLRRAATPSVLGLAGPAAARSSRAAVIRSTISTTSPVF